jgi:IS1 family transposase
MKFFIIILTIIHFTQSDDSIAQGSCLKPEEFRISSNGKYKLLFRETGRLAVERTDINCTAWETQIGNDRAAIACHQNDGHFVLYDGRRKVIWTSRWFGVVGVRTTAVIQDDGQFVIKEEDSVKFTSELPTYCNALDEINELKSKIEEITIKNLNLTQELVETNRKILNLLTDCR